MKLQPESIHRVGSHKSTDSVVKKFTVLLLHVYITLLLYLLFFKSVHGFGNNCVVNTKLK